MKNCEYVRDTYCVPACIGRRVSVRGQSGTIVADRGHYVGINLDCDDPSVIGNYHPVDGIVYFSEIKSSRKITRSQKRYLRFLEYGDRFDSFIDFCRWDADQERS